MARAEDVRALEALCPWERADFRGDLAALSTSTATAARAYAADVRVLARLAAQVPRCQGDESRGTPWTSFRQEVAVARSVSGQAAGAEIRTAVRLATVLAHTLDLLDAGRITAHRARVFVELEPYDDELARQIDHDHADRAAQLAPWRIRDLVRRAALELDADSAALRTATRTAARRVSLHPDSDDQASVLLTGPAVPLVRWYGTLDQRARALRQGGDPRNLDALRFDLATSTYPCTTHTPADPTEPAPTPATESTIADTGSGATDAPGAPADSGALADADGTAAADAVGTAAADVVGTAAADMVGTAAAGARSRTDSDGAADESALAGRRRSGVEAASTDCRRSRPVSAIIVVPVETALGLSNDPAWLDGYGWIGAPASRQLLVDAELRQLCAQTSTGALVDLAPSIRRPPPSPDGLRAALLDTVLGDITMSDIGWRTEPQHDPCDQLRTFVTLRDRTCDGPTQPRSPAATCELDHETPHPIGPTAAWNLAARSSRTHHLKHHGWTPIRTPSSTIWTSPAGQVIEVPHHRRPSPGPDLDPAGRRAVLPEPHELAATDDYSLTESTPDDSRPWVPAHRQAVPTTWTWLDHGTREPPPF